MTIGSSYREANQPIFNTSDVAVAVAMLPGDGTTDIPPRYLLSGHYEQYTCHICYWECFIVYILSIFIFMPCCLYLHRFTYNFTYTIFIYRSYYLLFIIYSVDEVINRFPVYSETDLTRADVLLHLKLISLGTIPMLQSHNSDSSYTHKHTHVPYASSSPLSASFQLSTDDDARNPESGSNFGFRASPEPDLPSPIRDAASTASGMSTHNSSSYILNFLGDLRTPNGGPIAHELQLSALLEGIRMGRVYLMNSFQAIAGLCVCTIG